jgi:alkanesulfonate monooxygenase SsuD/methylene tetrahydromethanopterin reductase-like flavin-dependent oxidoreductase (luciferase family)
VAAQTSKVRLGQAVMLSAYLNPVLLAKAAATIDVLSGGRFSLGMSIGGTEAEYRSIGVPMNQRVGRLMESIEIMRRLWREDNVAFEGRYNTIEKGTINPKPVQPGGVPIFLGANGPAMLRRIARVADGWVGSAGPIDRYIDGVRQVRAFALEQGRDPESIAFAKLQGISVHGDASTARTQGEEHWRAYYGPNFNIDAATIYGTPAQCAEQLQVFKGAECREMTLVLEPPGLGLDHLETLASFTASA